MSSTPTITQAEYDERKLFLEDLKLLNKDEYKEMFRILKRNNVEFSENSNGIFFDLVHISNQVFVEFVAFMKLCKEQRKSETERTAEMEILREETKPV